MEKATRSIDYHRNKTGKKVRCTKNTVINLEFLLALGLGKQYLHHFFIKYKLFNPNSRLEIA